MKCRCQFCGRLYTPRVNAHATLDYCKACSGERRKRAAEHFGTGGPIDPARLVGDYLLPPRNQAPAAACQQREPGAVGRDTL